jgi:hypothetical protein
VASLLSADMAIVWTTDLSEDVLLPSAWVGFPDEYIDACACRTAPAPPAGRWSSAPPS